MSCDPLLALWCADRARRHHLPELREATVTRRRTPERRYDGTDALLALCHCRTTYVLVSPRDVHDGTVWCSLCEPKGDAA